MPEVRLDTFEVDESNKFAVALCKAFVNLEKGYSPLLIHGERGSGKTHLLTAVTTEISLTHPEVSLLFLSDEVPPEDLFGEPGGSNGGSESRDLSRKDFLIVDDLERFAENASARDKFSAFFNTFVDNGKQILVATALPIKDIRGFDKRFLSRLSGGIDAHLSPPRPETRLKILKHECARLGLELDTEIMHLVMREAGKDAHYLKKLPGHLKTFATLNRQSLTKEKVEEFLAIIREQVGEEKGSATTEEILSSWVQLLAKKREDSLQATLQKYEQELSEQKERTRQLERELETISSREKGAAAEAASTKTKKGKPDLEQRGGLSTKELREQEELTRKLKGDYEKLLADKEAKIAELEASLSKKSSGSPQYSEQKRADRKIESLQAQLEQVNKERDDQLLALKIQLEDKEEKLALLREEREKRALQQQKGQSNLEERYEESTAQNLLLKKAVDELNARIKEQEKELSRSRNDAAKAAESRQDSEKENQELRRELQGLQNQQQNEVGRQANSLREAEQRSKQLQAELDQKNKLVDSLQGGTENERAEWQNRLNSVEAALKEKEKYISETINSWKSETQKRKKLEEELALLSTREQELDKTVATLSSSLETERARTLTYQQDHGALADRAKKVESELGSAQTKIQAISEREQELRQETEHLRADREKLKKNISGLTSDLLTSKSTIEQHSKTLSEKIGEVDRLIAANHELRNQLSEREQVLLTKEREEAERVRRFHEELTERDEELQAAEERLKAHETFLKAARGENENLASQVQKLTDELGAITKEREKIDQVYGNSLEEARAEVALREKKLSELRTGMESSNARADEITRRLDEVQKEWQQQLEQRRKEWAEREKALEKKNVSLQRENQEASANIKRLKSSISELEERMRQRDQLLEAKEKGESEHIFELKDELKRRNDEIQKLSADLSAANEKADEVDRRTAELAREIAAAKEEKSHGEEASSAALKEAEEKLRASREHAAALESKAQEIGKALSDLENQLEERENKDSANKEELSALREQISEAENEKKSLLAEKQKALLRVEELAQEAEQARKESDARLQEAREKLRKAQAREEELLARLESERTTSAERIEREQSETAAREKSFSEMKVSLETKLKAVSDEMQKYRLHAEQAEQANEEQADLRERAEQDALRLTNQLAEKDKRIAELQSAVVSLREDFSQKMAEGSETKDRFVSLQRDLTSKERTLASIRQDYSELQNDFDKLKSEMARAEKNAGKLRAENEKREQELNSRDEQLKGLREETLLLQKQKETADHGLAARVRDMERLLEEKDKALEQLELRASRLKVQSAEAQSSEVAKVQEEYQKRLMQQREENELLRKRLAAIEGAKQPAAPPAPAETAEPKKARAPIQTTPAPPQEFEEDEEESVEPAAPGEPVEPVKWLHSFDDFRCPDANSFTVGIAEKIARNLGGLYNPLCIYGAPNSGKTHLMHALGRLAAKESPNLPAKVISLPSLLERIEKEEETILNWPAALRLLVIDEFDISTVSPEGQTKLHKFLMQMLKKKAQIVIASQAPPIKMENLQECMLRFIEAGLLAKLEVDQKIRDEEKEAIESIVCFARTPFALKAGEHQQAAAKASSAHAPGHAPTEEKKDMFDLLLQPDSNLTMANFSGNEIFEEYEDIFKNSNKRWRNKFPLLIVEDDRQRRCHFFNALTHRLQGIFTGPVSLLSLEKLFLVISRRQAFDWNGLLNRLIKSHVVLVDDCDSISKFPASSISYLRAIIEEIIGRDLLLMMGMSKQYKKENVFGAACKKATKKKI